ncbi:MAG: hypothetical protein IKM43_00290 [Clostridia bacterium]|nr:hypothetical protein [Clostridia bacterium]
MNLMKYSTKITLYNSYFDFNDRLSAKSILTIFQDVASIHAEEIGVGYMDMYNKNFYWVLSRIKFDILKMPKINQTVIVETWPHPKGRVDFDRDMRILSEDGQVLIIATSKWCVIDTANRRLQRADNINYVGDVYPEILYNEFFGKISVQSQDLQSKFKYVVMFSDLDHNKHMNNTNYANLVLSVVENKFATHFEINFINECLLNDEIKIKHTKIDDGEYVVGEINSSHAFVAYLK